MITCHRLIAPTLTNTMTTHFERRSWTTPLRMLALLLFIMPSPASAHSETGTIGGFLRGRAIWTLPVVFPVVLGMGGALGVLGIPLPGVETGIALSGIILGAMVVLAAKPPLWVANFIVGIFAIFHAHGAELPEAANAVTFAVGFVISTGLLHLSGIAFGLLVKWPGDLFAVRAGGVVIALVGFGFLFKWL